MPPDIRWQQRFANFCQALDQLETFFLPPALNERELQGLIKAFEYCFELGWNTLCDLLLALFSAEPAVQEVWLYGSRAMGRHRPGSDIDLTLVAPGLRHADRLRLLGALDDLLLP